MDMQKVMLFLPRDLHHRLKIQAVTERKTLSEMITEAVAVALDKKGGEKKK